MALNAPPPYTDITGISRAVMKDNSQVTLANYNGNARPGELVVNLETNPPALYVGNNAGQLTAVSLSNNVNAVTIDVTNTNGLTTVYYPTFVEDRTTDQTVRADVDLTYRTDTNTLTVGALSATGNIVGNNIDASARVSGAFMQLNVSPLNNLPAATSAPGLRGFANDANLVAAGNFGAVVTDGGANIVPVWSDGSVWRIG